MRPTQAKDKGASKLLTEYLAGTPLVPFPNPLPFAIALSARFERGAWLLLTARVIRTIWGLAELSAISDRLVLIDRNNIPDTKAVEREKLINGAIALTNTFLARLLGAEINQRQGVIFRYRGRLLMVVPGATILGVLSNAVLARMFSH